MLKPQPITARARAHASSPRGDRANGTRAQAGTPVRVMARVASSATPQRQQSSPEKVAVVARARTPPRPISRTLRRAHTTVARTDEVDAREVKRRIAAHAATAWRGGGILTVHDLDSADERIVTSMLFRIAHSGTVSSMQDLLEDQASTPRLDVLHKSPKGVMETVLHRASKHGKLDFVHLLLSHNANPIQRDSAGQRPVDVAAANGHVDVVVALLLHQQAAEAFVGGRKKKIGLSSKPPPADPKISLGSPTESPGEAPRYWVEGTAWLTSMLKVRVRGVPQAPKLAITWAPQKEPDAANRHCDGVLERVTAPVANVHIFDELSMHAQFEVRHWCCRRRRRLPPAAAFVSASRPTAESAAAAALCVMAAAPGLPTD
eukprot:COSAG05_NODE_1517_length_4653_cov_48.023496_3_plen_376_part_00